MGDTGRVRTRRPTGCRDGRPAARRPGTAWRWAMAGLPGRHEPARGNHRSPASSGSDSDVNFRSRGEPASTTVDPVLADARLHVDAAGTTGSDQRRGAQLSGRAWIRASRGEPADRRSIQPIPCWHWTCVTDSTIDRRRCRAGHAMRATSLHGSRKPKMIERSHTAQVVTLAYRRHRRPPRRGPIELLRRRFRRQAACPRLRRTLARIGTIGSPTARPSRWPTPR